MAPGGRSGIESATAGRTWRELPAGWRTRTAARTITESDLMGFVTLAGLFEPLFLDARATDGGEGRRLVPGVLTLALAEGLFLGTQTIQGTGLALLAVELALTAPVFVGDTVDVEVEVTDSRPTARPGRGVVVTANRVFNQGDELVLEYSSTRLIGG